MELEDIIATLQAHSEIVAKFESWRGQLIGLWACAESGVDQANRYGWVYSGKTLAIAVPVSLGRKLKLFEEVNRLPPFEPVRDQGFGILEKLNGLTDDRHWMAHGYLIVDQSSTDRWVLQKHAFPKDTGGLVTLERAFSEEELEHLRFELIKLAFEFSAYLKTLFPKVGEHLSNDKDR